MSLKMYSNLLMLNKAELKNNSLYIYYSLFSGFILQVNFFACATQHTSTGNESFDIFL